MGTRIPNSFMPMPPDGRGKIRSSKFKMMINNGYRTVLRLSGFFVNHFRAIFSTTNPPSIFQQLTRGSLERWAVLHAEDLSHLCNIPEEKERRKLYSTM